MTSTTILPCDTVAGGQEKSPAANSELRSSDAPISAHIKYRVEYVNPEAKVIYQHEAAGSQLEDSTVNPNRTVLELVTTFSTSQDTHDESLGFRPTVRPVPPQKKLHIHSVPIMQALRSVVQYYPSQDLSSDIIKVSAPYAVLVHHYEELMQYRERCKAAANSSDDLCVREESAYEHIGVLKSFLDENIMPAVEAERERNSRGFHTFDMHWLSAKPGDTLFVRNIAGKEEIGVYHSISGGSFELPKKKWEKKYWTLTYDGEEIGRCLSEASTNVWDGEALITEKIMGPLSDVGELDMAADFIRRGRLYWNLLRKQCRYCKGRAIHFPHNEIEGLVMIDTDGFFQQANFARPSLMDMKSDSRNWVSDCTCSVCKTRREAGNDNSASAFEDYTIYPKNAGELDRELPDEMYLLLPGVVQAYVFRTRTWELVSVDDLSEPEFDNTMIENLVLNPKHTDLLKALAKSFIRLNRFEEESAQEPWSADFVKGKGSGLIFLLHGKPGVGKTLTAECVANFTNRPLMVLTSSDIGVTPEDVESKLTTHFKRAKRWGAVLVIDEADVFMERRSVADLTRNSLVAGFLRGLEFYDGILFLTTNRVGSFDDAFLSRIHVQLYYPEFEDGDRRKVWQTFIDKLIRERGETIRLNIDAKEYLESKELRTVKWNGREIRNAFQTAVALAEYEALKDSEGKIMLTDKHLRSVVEMSRDFKQYIDDIHQGNEDVRAERRRER